ncbi:MAG TPA: galactokinase [Acidimicrobiales bacterium]|nr:galactokinase [Acidimicrobiales bacterium]
MSEPASVVRATAPGRVNLIGDHTDYTGGFVLPMAIDRSVVVEGRRGGRVVRLRSRSESGEAAFPLTVENPGAIFPPWARYAAGVAKTVTPRVGFDGEIRSTVPVGAGLSSSAALSVAVALAFGFEGTALELAQACQTAEHVATGVPCGIMDQLASAAGVAGHSLLIDCAALSVSPVPMPEGVDVWVLRAGGPRRLVGSPYAERRAQCEAASAVVGPLRDVASVSALDVLDDALLRRRARHVVTENDRVLACADALRRGDIVSAGALMTESHVSLRDDFDVSTDALDAAVARLTSTPGVLGARLTGAGFGGSVVALAESGARVGEDAWRVVAVGGATVEEIGGGSSL